MKKQTASHKSYISENMDWIIVLPKLCFANVLPVVICISRITPLERSTPTILSSVIPLLRSSPSTSTIYVPEVLQWISEVRDLYAIFKLVKTDCSSFK